MKHCFSALLLVMLLAGGAYAAHGYATVLDSFSVEEWTTVPEDITYDGANFWITDLDNNELVKVTTTGSFLSSVNLPATIAYPCGIAWEGSAFWLIASPAGSPSIRNFYHVSTSGSILSSIPGVLTYYSPFGMQYQAGNCWVCSNNTDRKIYLHSMSNGAILQSMQTIAKYPSGICYDGTNLLVSGGDDGRTHRYSTSGSYLDYFAAPFTSNGYEGGSEWLNGTMYWLNTNARIVYHLSVDWNPPAAEPTSLGVVRSLFK
jgi:hypothetical protein